MAEPDAIPSRSPRGITMFGQYRACFAALTAAVPAITLAAAPAAAQSLDSLRASGAAAERYDGCAQSLDSSAANIFNGLNAKRKKIYAEDAKRSGASIDQAGRVFAQQIFAKSPPRTKFLQENGAWIQI